MLADLNNSKAELIQKVSDLSQAKAAKSRLLLEIDRLTATHEKEKSLLLSEQRDAINKKLYDAHQKWQSVRNTLDGYLEINGSDNF